MVVLTDDVLGVEYMKYHCAAGDTEDSGVTVQDGKNVRSIDLSRI